MQVRNIVSRTSQNIKACRSLVEICLRVNPYFQGYNELALLSSKMGQFQKMTQKILFQQMVEPSVCIFSSLPAIATVGGHLLNQNVGQDSLLLYLTWSQEITNDRIRELNELGLRQQELREVLIGFRNCVEGYTLNKSLKSRPGKMLRQIF